MDSEELFDDVDDSQVLAYLDEMERKPENKGPKSVEFRLDFSASRRNSSTRRPSLSSKQNVNTNKNSPIKQTTTRQQRTPQSQRHLVNDESKQTLYSSSKQSLIRSESPVTIDSGRLDRSPSRRSSSSKTAVSRSFDSSLKRVEPLILHGATPPPSPTNETETEAPYDSVTSTMFSFRPSPAPTPILTAPPVPVTLHSSTQGLNSTSSMHLEQVLNAERAAAATTTELLQSTRMDNESLRADLESARSIIQDLQHQIIDREATIRDRESHTIHLQLELDAAYATMERERLQFVEERETALTEQSLHFQRELETLQHQLTTANSIKTQVYQQHEQLEIALQQQNTQTAQMETQCRRLERELQAQRTILIEKTREYEQAQSQAKLEQEQYGIDLEKRCFELESTCSKWEMECQHLKTQLTESMHQQEAIQALVDSKRSQQDWNQAIQERFRCQVESIQSTLKQLTLDTKTWIKNEMKKIHTILIQLQQQASEVAIQHRDRAVIVATKQNRIIQLETQVRNERQNVQELETALRQTSRTLERKVSVLKQKYQEQREFLEITVAVRNGLTTELQGKKKQMSEMQKQMNVLTQQHETNERKQKQLKQQLKAMQLMYTRQMEKQIQSKPSQPIQEQQEWKEFIQLVQIYEEENRAQAT